MSLKRLFIVLCFFMGLSLGSGPSLVRATDSPYVILNFAQINELNWAAPEEEWQSKVKPQIVSQIREMRQSLSSLTSDPLPLAPKLAWSTLLEYMNFPLDTPTESSPYAIKTRRILEIAKEENFPIFLPLNGFQWWDELPELYNWWDPDGTKTDPSFFARQDNPEDFKKRFIAGYNPENHWNVEWQDPSTPMKLNVRNWGGGGFRLAPPPNLMDHAHTTLTYRKVQHERLSVILQEILSTYESWKKEGKESLLVGLTIGTEVSLNASVTPKDEFKLYGYRGIQDLGCEKNATSCQTEVVRRYLEENAQYIQRSGVPKDKIYTHVLGEQDPSDPHFGPYANAAFNLYSNPGTSLYGYAADPKASKSWQTMLETHGYPTWGAVEYTSSPTFAGLKKTLSQARLVTIYNWDQVVKTSAVSVIANALKTPIAKATCESNQTTLHVQSGITARLGSPEIDVTKLENLPHGIYSWFTETDCGNGQNVYSEPKIHYVPPNGSKDTTPFWVKWILQLQGK